MSDDTPVKERADYPDIFYSVEYEVIGPHWMNFWVYRMVGIDDGGDPVFEGDDGNPVYSFQDASSLISGFVKWDGCSEWDFDQEGGVHLCGWEGGFAFAAMMQKVYEHAESVLD